MQKLELLLMNNQTDSSSYFHMKVPKSLKRMFLCTHVPAAFSMRCDQTLQSDSFFSPYRFTATEQLPQTFTHSYFPYPLQQESNHISHISCCMSAETQEINVMCLSAESNNLLCSRRS